MKVRALLRFEDLAEGVTHAPGDEFEVSAKRAKEFQSGALVKVIDPAAEKAEAKAAEAAAKAEAEVEAAADALAEAEAEPAAEPEPDTEVVPDSPKDAEAIADANGVESR